MKWSLLSLVAVTGESYFVGNCTSNVPKNLTMSVSVVDDQICWVDLDMRVVAFDNQLEWLQATLLECRAFDWLFVTVRNTQQIDVSVMNVIENHAVVDLLIVDHPIVGSPIHQVSNGVISVDSKEQIRVQSDSCTFTAADSLVINSRAKIRREFRRRTIFSKTSMTNIWTSLLLAVLGGLIINLNIRQHANCEYSIPAAENELVP